MRDGAEDEGEAQDHGEADQGGRLAARRRLPPDHGRPLEEEGPGEGGRRDEEIVGTGKGRDDRQHERDAEDGLYPRGSREGVAGEEEAEDGGDDRGLRPRRSPPGRGEDGERERDREQSEELRAPLEGQAEVAPLQYVEEGGCGMAHDGQPDEGQFRRGARHDRYQALSGLLPINVILRPA